MGLQDSKDWIEQTPALGLPKFGQNLFLHSRAIRNSTRSPDPKVGLFFKTTELSGPDGQAAIDSHSHSPRHEASKLTLGQHLGVWNLHQACLCWKSKGIIGWLEKGDNELAGAPNGHSWHYLKGVPNPATLFPVVKGGDLLKNVHIETTEQTYSSRWTSWQSWDGMVHWCGVSFVEMGTW